MTAPIIDEAFARLDDQTWMLLGATAKQRAGAWPAHGLLLSATAYSRPAPEAFATRPMGGGDDRYFSTPDTTPTAANTRSNHDPTRPAGLGNQVAALMPTPNTSDAVGAGCDPAQRAAGRHQVNLADAVTGIAADATEFLPTPSAPDHKGVEQRGDHTGLTGALLPTPRASDGTKGSPHQHGSSGDLTLPSAVHLLPTPTAGDARSSAIQTVQQSGRPIPIGAVTLTDAARLLPTPSVADALGGHRSRSGTRSSELLLPGIAQSLAPATSEEPTEQKLAGSDEAEAHP